MNTTISNLKTAAQTAIKGCGEAYHCNAAIAEHGEAMVIMQRAVNLSKKYPTLSSADRTMLAAREVSLLQEITDGERPYFDVRTQLNQTQQAREVQGKTEGGAPYGVA